LQSRSKVRCLAYDASLLRFSSTDQVSDHNKPCGNSYARLERHLRLDATHSNNQLQARAHGSFCVVFMGLGIAEIHKHPIAHVLRHEATEALHGFRDALLVG
jgi:hypothetical protein